MTPKPARTADHATGSHRQQDFPSLPAVERAAAVRWGRHQGFDRPRVRGVKYQVGTTACLMADGSVRRGLVVVEGRVVLVGMVGPGAEAWFRDLPGPLRYPSMNAHR